MARRVHWWMHPPQCGRRRRTGCRHRLCTLQTHSLWHCTLRHCTLDTARRVCTVRCVSTARCTLHTVFRRNYVCRNYGRQYTLEI